MTPAMTADRIRQAERAAGVYNNDTITGLIVATTTLTVPGATADECDNAFITRYGQAAFDLIIETALASDHCTYVIEEGFELSCDYSIGDAIELLEDALPRINSEWTVECDCEPLATITY
ncbi:hypothetical protein [Corynebacterium liangguodongii]|uniref:Uncharacterized protein n=1 Tax=Corynebacterium liangguodongii TaxID=2079535 RepID=A0A2S0WGG7_9CORY|nr:hypothetical protein [Corynebacterium liangguodongii]AWB84814.1 hypothetical protein C3E79_10280 [Corynebacterium liangguodongii]PWB99171.1 hypothetical protein DF219_07895 [Corynebacterium liangguodongii]